MGFPGVYGVLFPVMVFKAALSLVVLKETACSVFNLLLGRGWHNPVSGDGVGSTDWVFSEEVASGSGFESRDSLIQDIRDRLNAVRFKDIARKFQEGEEHQCSVCLCDFEGEDEVFQLPQCSHIFHKECLGKWLGHGHTTCPLCRSTLASEELLEKRRNVDGTLQIDADLASEFALWFSVYHPEGGRGYWWQAYLQGIPDVLSGKFESSSTQARQAVGPAAGATKERLELQVHKECRHLSTARLARELLYSAQRRSRLLVDWTVVTQFLLAKFDVGSENQSVVALNWSAGAYSLNIRRRKCRQTNLALLYMLPTIAAYRSHEKERAFRKCCPLTCKEEACADFDWQGSAQLAQPVENLVMDRDVQRCSSQRKRRRLLSLGFWVDGLGQGK
ncbi:hypothetical protein R1flu_016322 [Riccia fluitans]|uniref:RING-type domain-containing protein n=1 Tax=Riccia fluitans TaxID=41844 RepID=A0ABD1YLI0_9MARC